jgi:hypothetical protein
MSRETEKLLGILRELAGGNSNLVLEAFRKAGPLRPWGRAEPNVRDLLFYIVDHRERAYADTPVPASASTQP